MHLDPETARRFVLEQIGFDLYQSPRFIEYFVCRIAGLNQTAKTVKWDGVDENGVKIEIKHAVIIRGKKFNVKQRYSYSYSYFCFSALQGTRRKGKGVDVFVMVGYDFETLRFFVIPATIVGKRRTIEILIDKRLCGGTIKGPVELRDELMATKLEISKIRQNHPVIQQRPSKWLEYETSIHDLSTAISRAAHHNLLATE